jgi:hypothetical protein
MYLVLQENLLRELDSGFSALPEGSSVTFVNAFPAEDTLARVLNHGPVENIRVRGRGAHSAAGWVGRCAQRSAPWAVPPSRCGRRILRRKGLQLPFWQAEWQAEHLKLTSMHLGLEGQCFDSTRTSPLPPPPGVSRAGGPVAEGSADRQA